MLVQQCALVHIFLKQQGCALIGACVLIRMSMVFFSRKVKDKSMIVVCCIFIDLLGLT